MVVPSRPAGVTGLRRVRFFEDSHPVLKDTHQSGVSSIHRRFATTGKVYGE